MSDFLIKRGTAARKGRSHAHIAKYDQFGKIAGAWCPVVVNSEWMSSNVPWGLSYCKHCINRMRAAS